MRSRSDPRELSLAFSIAKRAAVIESSCSTRERSTSFENWETLLRVDERDVQFKLSDLPGTTKMERHTVSASYRVRGCGQASVLR
jgi:hypothetical protein